MRFLSPHFGFIFALAIVLVVVIVFAPRVADGVAEYEGRRRAGKAIIPPHLDRKAILDKARKASGRP